MPSFLSESPVLWSVVALLSAVALAELYFRVRHHAELRLRVYPQVYIPDPDVGYRYAPNAEGEIRIPGISRRFRTNSQGFHAPDFTRTKPPHIFRIAIVGPSNITGIWMDGQGKNYSQLLEESLRVSGRQVEVMNFGIDGRYRSVYELRLLETDVVDYQPDLVLLDVELPFVHGAFQRAVHNGYVMIYNSENELSRKWCELTIDYVRRQRTLIALYKASYIVRAAARYYVYRRNTGRSAAVRVFIENRVQAPDIVLLPYSLKRSAEAIQVARDKVRHQGGELVLFQSAANPYVRHVSNKYQLPYVELDVPPILKYVHDHDGHYRQEGHVEIARQLFEQLISSGLLEQDRGSSTREAVGES